MAWVIDLDGVVWLGDVPIGGSADAVARLRAAGEQIAFVTNNSYETRTDVRAKLSSHGIEVAEEELLTSAMAAATLVSPGETVLVCAGPGVADELDRRGAEVVAVEGPVDVVSVDVVPVDVVMVGLDPAFDYQRMKVASMAVRAGARLVATNDDATYPTTEGLLPGGGAILASIERASGRRAMVAGKPYGAMCDLVRSELGPEGIVVGDRPETDGAFAEALGYRFGLVLSGVSATAGPGGPTPDIVADDLAALVDETIRNAGTGPVGQDPREHSREKT